MSALRDTWTLKKQKSGNNPIILIAPYIMHIHFAIQIISYIYIMYFVWRKLNPDNDFGCNCSRIFQKQMIIVEISNFVSNVPFFSSSLSGVLNDLLHFPAIFGMFVVDFEGNCK